MDAPRDYQEDEETKKLAKELQEHQDVDTIEATLDIQRAKEMMQKSFESMQLEDESPRSQETQAERQVATTDTTDTQSNEVRTEVGKILTDDREPGVSTHLHQHDDGVTISVKDQNVGRVERYNFNTGEGFEKNVSDMSPREAQRRMRSDHTESNPNPDKDTIPGFHSSVWARPPHVKEDEDHEE